MSAGRTGLLMVVTAVLALGAGTVVAEVTGPMARVVQASRVAPQVMDEGAWRVVPIIRGGKSYMGEFSLAPGAQLEVSGEGRDEYLYVLQGSALLRVNETTFFLGPRMGAYIPGEAEVTWVNGSSRLVAVQFFPAGSPYIGSQGKEVEEERPRRRRRGQRVRTRISEHRGEGSLQ